VGSFFSFIGTWFGYVGACVLSPDATCRPFLGFILMGAAASASLVLVIMAYRSAQAREAAEVAERSDRTRALESQDRVRRALAARSQIPSAPVQRQYHPAV